MASPFPRTIDASFADQLGTEIVTILVGPHGKKYTVHKNLLVSQSDYFDKALNGGFREAGENTIHLEEDDPAAIALLIAWLYRSVIPGAPSKSVYSVGAFPRSQSQTILPSEGTKYKVPHHTERDPNRVGFGLGDTLVYNSITAHPKYASYSPEELRLSDYKDGRKDVTFPASIEDELIEEPPSTRPGGLFSTDNSLFVGNPPSLFGPPTNTGLFGFPTTSQGGLFGGAGLASGTTNPTVTTATQPTTTTSQNTSLFGRQPGWPNASSGQSATDTTQGLFGNFASVVTPQVPSLAGQISRSLAANGSSSAQSPSPAAPVSVTPAATIDSATSLFNLSPPRLLNTSTNVVEPSNNNPSTEAEDAASSQTVPSELDRRLSNHSRSSDTSPTPSTGSTPHPSEQVGSSTSSAAVAPPLFPSSAVGSHTSSANVTSFSAGRPAQYPLFGPPSTTAPATRSLFATDTVSPFNSSSTENDSPSFERPINPGFDNVVAPFGSHTTPEHQDAILHLVLFAEATCWPILYNAAIAEYIAGERALARPPALEHITLIYDRTHEESTLRTWVIDMFAGFKGEVDRSGYMSLLVEYEGFLEGVVQKLREWGKDAREDTGFDGAGGLRYKMMDHDKKGVFGKGKEKEKSLKL